jgi:hypothetical protein
VTERPVQPGDLDMDILVGGVEAPLVDRAVDDAPHGGDADLHRVGDLPMGVARDKEIETGLAALDPLRPARFARGPLRGAQRVGWEDFVHWRLRRLLFYD